MSTSEPVARLNFRLPSEIKQVIEEAAAQSGQTVSDFAISTLVHAARQIVREQQTTRLSVRDRKIFLAMLDNTSSKPNKALTAAVKRYKKQVR
jgi:uncharacterized protein (DUF1778 family)